MSGPPRILTNSELLDMRAPLAFRKDVSRLYLETEDEEPDDLFAAVRNEDHRVLTPELLPEGPFQLGIARIPVEVGSRRPVEGLHLAAHTNKQWEILYARATNGHVVLLCHRMDSSRRRAASELLRAPLAISTLPVVVTFASLRGARGSQGRACHQGEKDEKPHRFPG